MLLGDSHDLIHKAAGWMLREVGKRDPAAVQAFLDSHCTAMPRTMLRYAIERLPEKKRRFYMMRKT
jgi:3-methyladenine DNA glycosylase AlkD